MLERQDRLHENVEHRVLAPLQRGLNVFEIRQRAVRDLPFLLDGRQNRLHENVEHRMPTQVQRGFNVFEIRQRAVLDMLARVVRARRR